MDKRNRKPKFLAYTRDQLKLLANLTDGMPDGQLNGSIHSAFRCFARGDGRQGVYSMFAGLGLSPLRARGSYTIHASETRRPLAIKMNGMKATVLEKKKRVCEWDFEEHLSCPEMANFFSFVFELSRQPMPTSKPHRPKRTVRQATRLPSRLRQSTSTADINQENEIHEPDKTPE